MREMVRSRLHAGLRGPLGRRFQAGLPTLLVGWWAGRLVSRPGRLVVIYSAHTCCIVLRMLGACNVMLGVRWRVLLLRVLSIGGSVLAMLCARCVVRCMLCPRGVLGMLRARWVLRGVGSCNVVRGVLPLGRCIVRCMLGASRVVLGAGSAVVFGACMYSKQRAGEAGRQRDSNG